MRLKPFLRDFESSDQRSRESINQPASDNPVHGTNFKSLSYLKLFNQKILFEYY